MKQMHQFKQKILRAETKAKEPSDPGGKYYSPRRLGISPSNIPRISSKHPP